MKKLIKLYLVFFKIGLFTFGGGYAMLPIIQRELVRLDWATEEDILNYVAIGQCTPGVIAVNVSAFVGNKIAGKIGAIAATLGVITPSLIIITLITTLLSGFTENKYVAYALAGVRVAVCVLIIDTALSLISKSVKDIVSFAIFALVLILSYFFKVPTAVLVLASALFGVIFSKFRRRKITGSGKGGGQ